MSVLLLRYLPWLAGVLVIFGAGTYTGWHMNPWESRYRSLQASDAIERMHGEEAVRAALTAQLAQAQTVTRNNQSAMVILANQNAQTAADRDATVARVHRLEQLLSAAAARAAAGRIVSQTRDRSAAAGASDPPSPSPIEGLLVAASAECQQTANQLNALIQEIKLQL